ncbi:MAG: twin-arginine translocase TatA/TatE family subunit [Hyphomicrobiaceae bacterium]
MGAMSIWHWLILLLIVVLMFGRGKISEIMGDVAKGIKSFKQGMAEDDSGKSSKDDAARADPKVIDHTPASGSTPASADQKKVG